MKLPKKVMTAALLTASLFMTGCGSQVNIGYVDGGKIMDDSPQIQTVIKEGQKKAEELQNETIAALESNPDWTDEEKAKAINELQRKLDGINQAYSTQLKYKFDEVMAGIAEQKKLDVIIDSSESQKIIFVGGVDVTNEVIQKLQ